MIEVYLLLGSVIVALFALIVNVFSTIQMKKQVNLQLKQWELINKPIFIIDAFEDVTANNDEYWVVVKNTNNVFHILDTIESVDKRVEVSVNGYGNIRKTIKEQTDINEGYVISLQLDKKSDFITRIELKGIDSIGNHFHLTTPEIECRKGEIANIKNVYKKYFKNV